MCCANSEIKVNRWIIKTSKKQPLFGVQMQTNVQTNVRMLYFMNTIQ